MTAFFIVGPTATGKSEIAAAVADRCDAEIIGADAYQIYRGLDRLTAKPDAPILARARHHLIGTLAATEELSAVRFRELAMRAIHDIGSRGKNVIVAGGSGLYVRALTDGFSPLPASDPKLRERLEALSLRELNTRLRTLDPDAPKSIDTANKRRVLRAVEICVLTGRPLADTRVVAAAVSGGRSERASAAETAAATTGVFVFRERDELYQRINLRVEQMFAHGVVEEVREAGALGPTAGQTLGLREIRQLLAGEMTEPLCIAAIQQATRRYAKRQLTWFRRQSNFEPLNLSDRTAAEAIEWITRRARLFFAHD